MALIVQKFGGSSVKDAAHIKNVAGIIADTYLKKSTIVVTNTDPGVGASVSYADGTLIFVKE